MWRKQFFRKIFWSIVLLVLLYSFLGAGVLVKKTKEMHGYQTEVNQQTFFESSTRSMDNALKVGSNWIYQLKLDENIKEFSQSKELDYYTVTQIYNELVRISAVFSDFGYNIGISKPGEKIVITPSRTLSKESFFNDIASSNELIDLVETSDDRIGLEYFDSDDYFTVVRNEKIKDHTISFYLTFLKQYYLPEVSEKEGFGILIDGKLESYMGKSDGAIDQIFPEDTILSSLKDELTSDIFQTSIADDNVYIQQSEVLPDLAYVYVTPQSSNFFNMLSWRLLTFLVLTILIGSIIAIYLTRRAYKPLDNVLKVFKQEGISSDDKLEDELSFIEENYMTVKRDHDHLLKIMQDKSSRLKVTFYRNLIFGVLTKESIHDGIQEYHIPFLRNPLRVVIIELRDFVKLEEEYPKETIRLIKQELLDMLGEEFSTVLELSLFELDYKQFGAIIKNEELPAIIKTLQHTFSTIEEKTTYRFVAAIGKVVVKNHNLRKSYVEAEKLIDQQYALPEKSVITIDDIQDLKDIGYHYPLERERLLINYIVQGNEDKALIILDEILEQNFNNQDMTTKKARQLINAFSNTITRIISLINDDQVAVFKDDNKIGGFILNEDYHAIKEYIYDYFQKLIYHINSSKKDMDEKRKEDMVTYIKQNYELDISLQDLAEHFNLSAGYISTLFKEYMGENFKEYLNNYRIAVAKQMLQTNKYQISEIAEKTGYNSTNSFIRVFKKYEGISPGKYVNLETEI